MLIYLASPYSHPDEAVRQQRFEKVCQIAADLMVKGYFVFSPIAHSHPVAVHGNVDQLDLGFWLRQDLEILRHCDQLWVCEMDGWELSSGIRQEVAYAEHYGIEIVYLSV